MAAKAKNLYRFFYNLTGKSRNTAAPIKRFMNLGYESENPITINPEDQVDSSHINLYYEILQGTSLADKTVLEVGCGRGGGAYYYTKYHQPKAYTGIDLSKENITICNKQNEFDNCNFKEADAESFSFNNIFDVIINLESSHCYRSKKAFFNNVQQSLKTDGTFIYADIRKSDKGTTIEQELEAAGFIIKHKKEITKGVVKAIDEHSAARFPFTHKYPYLVPKTIKNINVSQHSDTYNKLKSGAVSYWSYILKKN